MRTIWMSLVGLAVLSTQLFAGALILDISNPVTNHEAQLRHTAVIAQTTACHSPEKTRITATAEGMVNGTRCSIRLTLTPLETHGAFAIAQEWPATGVWALRIIATNPEYEDFSAGALVPVHSNVVDWAAVQHYFHEPTDAELASVLQGGNRNRADLR